MRGGLGGVVGVSVLESRCEQGDLLWIFPVRIRLRTRFSNPAARPDSNRSCVCVCVLLLLPANTAERRVAVRALVPCAKKSR